MLAIDDDGSFYNAVIRHGARRLARPQDIRGATRVVLILALFIEDRGRTRDL